MRAILLIEGEKSDIYTLETRGDSEVGDLLNGFTSAKEGIVSYLWNALEHIADTGIESVSAPFLNVGMRIIRIFVK